jgi:hypothetical protein
MKKAPDARREPLCLATGDGAYDHIGDAWAGSDGEYHGGEQKVGSDCFCAIAYGLTCRKAPRQRIALPKSNLKTADGRVGAGISCATPG